MFCYASQLNPFSATFNRLIRWSRQAGQIALDHLTTITPTYKPDQTLITQADLDVERFLTERIKHFYPNYNLIGEEGSRGPEAGTTSAVWVIDPIDGTTAYTQGLPGWGISIGLLRQGQPDLGLFYMPLLNDLTYATRCSEVYCNERRLTQTVRRDWGQNSFLAINASAHHDFRINIRRTRALGSIGASLVYTARGASIGAFIPKAYLWDLVAGAAILTQAGGELRYLSGQPVDYLALMNGYLTPEPILACHPDMFDELKVAIEPYQKE